MKTLILALLTCSLTALIAAEPPQVAIDAIDSKGLLEHIKVLSSDKFEGRAPGTPGEVASIEYLTAQFQKLGLKPGNPNGTFIQEVPLAGIFGTPTASFTIAG